jgi:hypothetical protein
VGEFERGTGPALCALQLLQAARLSLCKLTPAMVAGITDHISTIEELIQST